MGDVDPLDRTGRVDAHRPGNAAVAGGDHDRRWHLVAGTTSCDREGCQAADGGDRIRARTAAADERDRGRNLVIDATITDRDSGDLASADLRRGDDARATGAGIVEDDLRCGHIARATGEHLDERHLAITGGGGDHRATAGRERHRRRRDVARAGVGDRHAGDLAGRQDAAERRRERELVGHGERGIGAHDHVAVVGGEDEVLGWVGGVGIVDKHIADGVDVAILGAEPDRAVGRLQIPGDEARGGGRQGDVAAAGGGHVDRVEEPLGGDGDRAVAGGGEVGERDGVVVGERDRAPRRRRHGVGAGEGVDRAAGGELEVCCLKAGLAGDVARGGEVDRVARGLDDRGAGDGDVARGRGDIQIADPGGAGGDIAADRHRVAGERQIPLLGGDRPVDVECAGGERQATDRVEVGVGDYLPARFAGRQRDRRLRGGEGVDRQIALDLIDVDRDVGSGADVGTGKNVVLGEPGGADIDRAAVGRGVVERDALRAADQA